MWWGIVLALFVATGCTSSRVEATHELARFEYSRYAMGCEARVVLYAASEDAAISAANAAFERIEAIEQQLSDWRATSDLERLRAAAGTGFVGVGADLYAVMRTALCVAEDSGGAFDPTVGPLVRSWRAARSTRILPEQRELDAARSLVDWRLVAIDPNAPRLALERAGMRLDLGGIGKGYACSAAIATLAASGIDRALVAIAGDIAVGAAPPASAGWSIDAGTHEDGAVHERLTLAHQAISTSGDTEQFVEIDGKRYSHIVDPHTGLGLTSRRRVTVLARDGATADALATAISVLGGERGLALARRHQAAALVEEFGAAGSSRSATESFDALLAPSARAVER